MRNNGATPATWLVMAAAALTASPAVAAAPAPTAAIAQFLAAMDRGDMASAEAACLPDVAIIDDVPPFLWSGRGAFARWGADLAAHDKAAVLANHRLTTGAATREVVAGDTAYVVLPASFAFTVKGVAQREAAQISYVLKRRGDAWKIAAWTFAGAPPELEAAAGGGAP